MPFQKFLALLLWNKKDQINKIAIFNIDELHSNFCLSLYTSFGIGELNFFIAYFAGYHRAPGHGFRRFGFGRRPQFGDKGFGWTFPRFIGLRCFSSPNWTQLCCKIISQSGSGMSEVRRSFEQISDGILYPSIVSSFYENADPVLSTFTPMQQSMCDMCVFRSAYLQ